MSKRLRLSRLLEVFHVRSLLAAVTKPSLIVINYHRIYDSKLETDFDDGVFGHSTEEFERHVSWLSESYNVLDEDQLILLLDGQLSSDKPNAVITFDDGYIDNYTLAFPILRKYGLSATFFVPFLNIENRELGWWDLVAWCVKLCKKESIQVSGREFPLGSSAQRFRAIKEIQKLFKDMDFEKTKGLIGELVDRTGVELPSTEQQSQELMTWPQLSEMEKEGMSIGSHTMSHRLLSRISDEEQDWEIGESKRKLEDKLGVRIRSIAYPVGQRESFNQYSMKASQAAGYEMAFSFYSGYYRKNFPERFDIKRVCLSGNYSLFVSELLAPGVFLP